MKLSMSMLDGYLKNYDRECVIQDDSCTIHGMRFLSEKKDVYSREFVYIGEAPDYLKDPRYSGSVILASGKSNIFCRNPDYEELLNDVLAAFDFYNDAERRLIKVSSQNGSLSEALSIIGEIIRDPFLVFGLDGSFLGGSHIEHTPSEILLEDIIKRGYFSAISIGRLFTDAEGNVRHDLTGEPQVMFGENGECAVNMYLERDGEAVGFIMCFPADERGTRLAMSLEPLVSPFLIQASEFTASSSPHQALRLAAADLVSGTDVSDESVERLERAILKTSNLYVVTVRSLGIQNHTQRLLLARDVEAMLHCVAFEMDETTGFLVAEELLSDLIAQVEQGFERREIVSVGISMPIADVRHLPSAYRQAAFARDYEKGPGVRFCHDLALPFLLRTMLNEPAVHDLLHPAIGMLEAYDARSESELLRTLKVFIACGCSQSESAKRLHIHLNTLKYRLKRISELTAIDLSDHQDVFYMQLSFRFLDI